MANTYTGGLIAYEDVFQRAQILTNHSDSSLAVLLTAINDIQFGGIAPAEVCANLSTEDRMSLELIAGPDCKHIPTNRKKDGVVINATTMELLIHKASVCDEPYIEKYFSAMYAVRFESADPDAVLAATSGPAGDAFLLTRARIIQDRDAYIKRCEQNKKNASRSVRKKHDAESDTNTAIEHVPSVDETAALIYPDTLSDQAVVNVSSVTELSDTAADATIATPAEMEILVSSSSDTPEDNDPIPTDSSTSDTSAVAEHSDTFAPIRSNSLQFADENRNKSEKYKNNIEISLSSTSSPRPGMQEERERELLAMFKTLTDRYPKSVLLNRAWSVFQAIDPDDILFKSIMTGLADALVTDRRFQSGDRYIPLLSNWLEEKCWLPENMLPIPKPISHEQEYSQSVIYSQRPPLTEAEMHQRADASLRCLKERYGHINS